ncbi:MAG: KH domain-containing protein [Armatimonadetes bacterium]|nr:KH domain-containing protein [Armatimonadota bacterium]
MKDLIELLTRALVEHPEEVEVREVEGPEGVTLEIYVAPGDTGKVIGRGGRIISALRTVAKAASVKEGRRVFVEIMA